MVERYLFAGLDFVFDKHGHPWFIEANSAPKGLLSIAKLYSFSRSLTVLAKLLNSFAHPAYLISSSAKSPEYTTTLWMFRELKKHVPQLNLCYALKNRHQRTYFRDVNNHSFRPDAVFKGAFRVTRTINDSVLCINHVTVSAITKNKYRTLRLLKDHLPEVYIPNSFVVKSTKELNERIRRYTRVFRDGYVVKPLEGSRGMDVHVFNREERTHIHLPRLLEQRILPHLRHQQYWDMRVYVANGRFTEAFIRESSSRVTNISRGGHSIKAPRKLLKKIRSLSEDIVAVIDEEACRLPTKNTYTLKTPAS